MGNAVEYPENDGRGNLVTPDGVVIFDHARENRANVVMNIEQANHLLARAKEDGLISYEGDMIRPLFDVISMEIPLGFKPNASVFHRSDPHEELMSRIARDLSIPLTRVVAEMNTIISKEFGGHIRPEGAVVILAKRSGVEFSDLLPALRENILKSD